MKKWFTGAVCAMLLVSTAGCAKMSEPFQDAERGASNTGPADTNTAG